MTLHPSPPPQGRRPVGWRARVQRQLGRWVATGSAGVNDVSAQRKVRQTNVAALLAFSLLYSFAGVYAVTGATGFVLSAIVHLFWGALAPVVMVLNHRRHHQAAKHLFMVLLHGVMLSIIAIQALTLSVENYFLLFCVIAPMLFESRHWRAIIAWCCVSLVCYGLSVNLDLDPLPLYTATVSPGLAGLFESLVMMALMVALIGMVIFSEASSARSERQLQTLAETDALTGLANRRAFEVRLDQVLAEKPQAASRPAMPPLSLLTDPGQQPQVCLLLMDVDHFKRINDTWGHEAGDRVLQQVAQVLREATQRGDFAARVGGEEFVLLLSGTPPALALAHAEHVCQAVRQQVRAPGGGRPVTISIGVAVASSSPTRDALLRHADEALYTAKHDGRNQVRRYDPCPPTEGPSGRVHNPQVSLFEESRTENPEHSVIN